LKTDPIPDSQMREPTTDTTEQEQQALIGILIKTVEHFFGGFHKVFKDTTDPREQGKITYSLASICFAGVLMFLILPDFVVYTCCLGNESLSHTGCTMQNQAFVGLGHRFRHPRFTMEAWKLSM